MKIYEVPEGRRYWVVRAADGLYFDHFTKHGIIAVGHLNELHSSINNHDPFLPNEISLRNSVSTMAQSRGAKKRQELAILNQLKTFIYEMKEDDWVITVGYKSLRVGLIDSLPYISKESIIIYQDIKNDIKIEMDYILRRKVRWGPSIPRKTAPYGLLSSLKANQTVFNIDKNWQAIYHSIYPAFSHGNDLHLSLKIRTEHEVKNYSVVKILQFLNDIELIAKEFGEDLDSNNFDDLFSLYASKDLFSLTTKAQFSSPGDIWNKITFSGNTRKKMAYALMAYAMIFGNDHTGMDGILDLETRKQLWQIVIDRLQQREMQTTVAKLELSKPQYNTTPLESRDKRELAVP